MEYIQADIWVRFQRMQGNEVHFVGADDTHGAPIMIAAEKAGITPQQFVANIAAGRKQYLDGFHIAFDNWTPPTPGKPRAVAGHLPRARGRLIDTKPSSSSSTRSRTCSCRPLHQGRMPQVRRQGPVRRQLRVCGAVCADRPEEPVLGPVRRHAGAEASEHYFFKLSDPRCVEFLRDWALDSGRLQPEVANKVANGWTAKAAWATGTSAATRPTSASRFPTHRASTSTSGWTRRSATWPR
jgi:methionyl-tRNA synthetase